MPLAPGYDVDWNLVRTFTSVVEAGSLAGAARSLNLAHPTVARHIQQLEAQLGVSLFERQAGGLALNESGQRMAEVAERMRRDAVMLESVVESVRSDTTGRVVITIAEMLADLFPELLLPLVDAAGAGDRTIELTVSPRRLNLLNLEADIAVRHVRPEQNDLICRRVGGLSMGAWVSEAYVRRYGLPTFDTLSEHRIIDGLSGRYFCLALERLGIRIPEAQVAFRTDSVQTQRRAAELGWGIAGLPDYLAERTDGLLRALEDPDRRVTLDIWLVGRPAVRQQKRLQMVFDMLASGLEERFGASRETPAVRIA